MKDLHKWKDIHCSSIGRLNSVKTAILLYQHSKLLSSRYGHIDPKINMDLQEKQNSHDNLEKRTKLEDLYFPFSEFNTKIQSWKQGGTNIR